MSSATGDLGLGFGGLDQAPAAPSAPAPVTDPGRDGGNRVAAGAPGAAAPIAPSRRVAGGSAEAPSLGSRVPERAGGTAAGPGWGSDDLNRASHVPPEPPPAGSRVNLADGSVMVPIRISSAQDMAPAFWAALHPVTCAQYLRFVEATGRHPGTDGEGFLAHDRPITGVTYSEALAYCEWSGLHLPTFAEWWLMASGVDENRYPWGNVWDDAACRWWGGNRGTARTARVFAHPRGRSPYGLYDCAGNVAEWCMVSASDTSQDGMIQRPLAGGSWRSVRPIDLVTSRRVSWLGCSSSDFIGFRPIRRTACLGRSRS